MKNKSSFKGLPFWRVFSISRPGVLLFSLLIIFALLLSRWWANWSLSSKDQSLSVSQLITLPDHLPLSGRFATQTGQIKLLKLELVNSQSGIGWGLSGREKIGSDGMLFVFRQAQVPQFWMKEMLFDLDFVWLLDGEVVDLTADVKAPRLDISLDSLPTYSPGRPVNMVLEVPAGSIDTWQLQLGDRLDLFDKFI